MNNLKRFFSALALIMLTLSSDAQELNGRVSVVYNQISTTIDRKVFKTLQTALTDFLNKRKWTSEDYGPQEKISCNFLLNLTSSPETNVYKASLTVQAARPVYNSTYQAPLINFIDNDVVFRYVEFQPIEFNENRVQGTEPLTANLTAVFAYYVNIILGLDNDSFSPRGGDLYFKKANAIVNSSPDGRLITGWKPFDSQRNRYWLAENLVNSRYSLVHDAIYTYYRLGMDQLSENENKARQEVVNALSTLYTLHEDNPNIMIYQFFFQGKSDELIRMLKKANPGERARAIEMLQKIDITNAARYKQELK
jgi:hypothetical protein